MSIGKKLQEMEVSSKKSVTAVNKGAVAAEAMPKINTGIVDGQTGSAEDLGVQLRSIQNLQMIQTNIISQEKALSKSKM